MTIIISPAKKLTPTNNSLGVETTRSEFPNKLNELVNLDKSASNKKFFIIGTFNKTSSILNLAFLIPKYFKKTKVSPQIEIKDI